MARSLSLRLPPLLWQGEQQRLRLWLLLQRKSTSDYIVYVNQTVNWRKTTAKGNRDVGVAMTPTTAANLVADVARPPG